MPFEKSAHQNKDDYIKILHDLFHNYNKVAVVTSQQVKSNQLMKIRTDISSFAEIVFCKNSLMRRAVDQLKREIPSITELEKYLTNGAGLIFTNGSFKAIKEVIDANCRYSAAKAGSIAPCDVIIKRQLTSIPYYEYNLFIDLQIPCKFFKGTIEVAGKKQLVWKGQKIRASEARVLEMLGIKPFKHTLKIEVLYDNGTICDPEACGLGNEIDEHQEEEEEEPMILDDSNYFDFDF